MLSHHVALVVSGPIVLRRGTRGKAGCLVGVAKEWVRVRARATHRKRRACPGESRLKPSGPPRREVHGRATWRTPCFPDCRNRWGLFVPSLRDGGTHEGIGV